MRSEYELNREILNHANEFSEKWLPKIESFARSIRETKYAISTEEKEYALQSGSYPLQCAREQHIKAAKLCSELWDELAGWEASIIPLYPSVECDPVITRMNIKEDKDFSILLIENVLSIRMPFPIKRYAKKKIVAPALNVLRDKLSDFIVEREDELNISGNCVFYFWYVYPRKSGKAQWYYPDNDNYLVKPIIDTVCEVVSIQDTGTDAFMFYATMLSSEVPEGAYLFIAPQSDAEHNLHRQKNALEFIKNFSGL